MRFDKMQEGLLIIPTPEVMVRTLANSLSWVKFPAILKPSFDNITQRQEDKLEADLSYLTHLASCNTLSLNRILRAIPGFSLREELPLGSRPCPNRRKIIKAKFKISSSRASLESNRYRWDPTSLWLTKDITRRSQRVLKSNPNSLKVEVYAKALAKERTRRLQGQFIRISDSKASWAWAAVLLVIILASHRRCREGRWWMDKHQVRTPSRYLQEKAPWSSGTFLLHKTEDLSWTNKPRKPMLKWKTNSKCQSQSKDLNSIVLGSRARAETT